MDKRKAKADLSKKFNADGNLPILLIAADKEIPKDLMQGFSVLPVNTIILSKHMNDYETLLWASDFILILSGNPERYLTDAWQNGVIPVVSASVPGARNYDPNRETGNSFTFKNENVWEIFAALVRALETFKFPYDWKHLMSLVRENV